MLAKMPSLLSKPGVEARSRSSEWLIPAYASQRPASALVVRDSTVTAGQCPAQGSLIRFQQADSTRTAGFSVEFAAESVKEASGLDTSLSLDSVFARSGTPQP